MVRYERGTHFQELTLDGAEVLVRTEAGEERVACAGPVEARWEYDKRIALAIAGGLRATASSAGAEEARSADFEAAIRADPDDEGAYLVYADWLQQQGEPRGELICVQHALAVQKSQARTQNERFFGARTMELERAELLLLMTQRERFAGSELAEVHSVAGQRYLIDLFDLEWQLGFLRRAALPHSLRRDGMERSLWEPLLQSTSALFLRDIHAEWSDAGEIAAAIPETLDKLELTLDPWWPPEREEDAANADADYRPGAIEEVFGSRGNFVPEILAQLEPFLRAPPPRLRELVLQRCFFARELLARLPRSPLRKSVRCLDLSGGSLVDGDVPLVQQLFDSWKFERLDLRRNRFSAAGRRQVALLGSAMIVERR